MFTVNGRQVSHGGKVVKNGIFKELSLVSVGADAGNSLTISASANQEAQTDQKGQTAMSESNVTPTDGQQTVNETNQSQPTTETQPATPPTSHTVNATGGEAPPAAPALQPSPPPITHEPTSPPASQTVNASGNQWINQLGMPANPINTLTNEPNVNATICASFAHSMGLPLDQMLGKSYGSGRNQSVIDQRALDMATSAKYRNNGSIHKMVGQTIEASGVCIGSTLGRNVSSILADSWKELNASGSHSTNPLVEIFQTAIQYVVEQPYEAAQDVWPLLVTDRQLNAAYTDGRTISAAPVSEPSEVPITAQVNYGTFDELSGQIRAKRYAINVGVDDIQLDQDDLGMLLETINGYRESMTTKKNKVFWYETFFPAVEDATLFANTHPHTRKADGSTFDMGDNLMTEGWSEGSMDRGRILILCFKFNFKSLFEYLRCRKEYKDQSKKPR